MSKPEIIALLPIKQNSERVTNKNFRLLIDKPLYCWILNTLLAISEINRVVINTDVVSKFEKNYVPHNRVVIRERKPDLCGDCVSMNLILADDMQAYKADFYIMTHVTNPFLSQDTISKAINIYQRDNTKDSLFSVTRHQSRFYDICCKAINHDPNNLIRTQDLDPLLEENSCLYIFSRQSFALTGARIGKAPILFETPILESVDIDTEDDWKIAEALAKSFNMKALIE